MEFKHHKLANGLEIVAECNPRAYSFGAAFFVNTGSRDEDAPVAGVSHFLEHMMFKGTAKRSASDVNRELDEIGSRANAYTSEENTVYHAVVLPEYQDRLVELLADMLRPSLRASDFEVEQKVILEEISKYDDEPPFRVAELCMAAYFGQHPMANSVLGSVESVSGLTPDSMRGYFERRYRPGNIVLAAAGCVDFAKLVEHAEQYCGGWEAGETPRARPPVKPRVDFQALTKSTATQQYAYKITPGPSSNDPDRFAADILAAVIGDDSGSRLYWELTDTGRVDFAVMGADQYDGAGAIISYICCEPALMAENLQRMVDVQREVERENITAKELAQAQNKICSHLVRQSERPASRMFSIGNSWLSRREYLSVRDLVDAYRRVTLDDIARILAKYPLTQGTTVTIGPLEEVKAPS